MVPQVTPGFGYPQTSPMSMPVVQNAISTVALARPPSQPCYAGQVINRSEVVRQTAIGVPGQRLAPGSIRSMPNPAQYAQQQHVYKTYAHAAPGANGTLQSTVQSTVKSAVHGTELSKRQCASSTCAAPLPYGQAPSKGPTRDGGNNIVIQSTRMLSLELNFDGDFVLNRKNAVTQQTEKVPLLLKAEHPTADGETGLRVWDAGITMAKWWEAHQDEIRGKRVLELGCGTAISGLSMALLGAHVVVTDQEVIRARTEQNLAFNNAEVQKAGGSCRFATLDWNNLLQTSSEVLGREPFDFVIASDVIWNPFFIEPFLKACNYFKDYGSGHPRILMAHKVRDETLDVQFSEALVAAGFCVSWKKLAEEFIPKNGLLNEKCEVSEFGY